MPSGQECGLSYYIDEGLYASKSYIINSGGNGIGYSTRCLRATTFVALSTLPEMP